MFAVFLLFTLDKLNFSYSSTFSAIEHVDRKKSDLVSSKKTYILNILSATTQTSLSHQTDRPLSLTRQTDISLSPDRQTSLSLSRQTDISLSPDRHLSFGRQTDISFAAQTLLWAPRHFSGRPDTCLTAQTLLWPARHFSGRPDTCADQHMCGRAYLLPP